MEAVVLLVAVVRACGGAAGVGVIVGVSSWCPFRPLVFIIVLFVIFVF